MAVTVLRAYLSGDRGDDGIVGPMFAECLLPLPLQGTFTYHVPAHLTDSVQVGCRVYVPFGKSRQYAALVVGFTPQPSVPVAAVGKAVPGQVEVKDIISVLDAHPMLLPRQLQLWRWVADYYMCTLGEVYKAAIPSGLKEKDGVVRYRPKTVACIRLADAYFDSVRLNVAIGSLHVAPRQQQVMMCYVEQAGVNDALAMGNPALLKDITREELMKAAGCSSAVLKAVTDRGMLVQYDVQVSRIASSSCSPDYGDIHPVLPVLSSAQEEARSSIVRNWHDRDVCLLHGVTSSGKTEIYIHLIQQFLDQGRQVLFLLPEIVLTSQLTGRLRRVFGERLGVYHSRYTDAERVEVYQKQVGSNPYDIIVGVRSSVLLPFQRLGLVIVDEEHENSFKQSEPAPRYHARNVALVMARMAGAKTLLGTATPSLESYYNAKRGKYGLVRLLTRYSNVALPEIKVVDVRDQKRRKLMRGPFSALLLDEMRERLKRGEQVILFQNRRGFAPQVECQACGWVPQCPHCDVSLTLHKRLNRLVCHYCGYSQLIPTRCPQCEGDSVNSRGYGTERIEEMLQKALPGVRIARMDLDTTRSRKSYEAIIERFQHGETDILVGTQMVTKGLDFRNVTLVGILDAGTMLNQPDFRSYEHAFQMMTQVSGRAGRSVSRQGAGTVILQCHDVANPIVQQVVDNDYEGMYAGQMEERRMFNYPPFCRLIYVYMKHRDERVLDHLATEMGQLLRRIFAQRVLGPDVPPVARVQTMFIRKVLLKMETSADIADVRMRLWQVRQYLSSRPEYKSAVIYFDVD